MTDPISGSSNGSYNGEDCDEATGVCGRREPEPIASPPAGPTNFEPAWTPPMLPPDPKGYAELAKNMAPPPAQPKLDELSWKALRDRIATLESSGKDPDQLKTFKQELARRQGVAAETAKPSDTNAGHFGPYAEASAAKGQANAKLMLGRSSDGKVEVGSISATVGANIELSGAAVRLHEKTTRSGTTTAEIGSGKVSVGVANSDGSYGFHVAAQANVAAAEHTEQTKEGASATGGLSVGHGFELSFGFKGDGICGRVGVGPITLGGCTLAPGQQATWGDDGSGDKK